MKRAAKSINLMDSDGESYDSDEESAIRGLEGDKQKSSKLDSPTDDVKKDGMLDTEVPIELQKKKKVRTGRPFTEADIVGSGGIAYIYKTFPRILNVRTPGNESNDLNKLICMYKEWAFRLYPGLAFPDLITKVDQLGSKGVVRSELDRLRDEERNKYLEAQGVNVRELLEKKRADDLRRQELVKKFEEALNKMKRSDADSFIASDSDSDSDSTNQNLDKVKKNAKGLMDKKKKLKKNKRKIDGDKENSDNNRMTQEQIGDVNAEEEEAEMSDSSSSDDDSLVIGSDDGNDDEKDVNEDDDTAHKKVKTSENVVKKTYGKKVIPSILPPIDKDTEEVDEQEATGAQDNYDFLDSLDFIE